MSYSQHRENIKTCPECGTNLIRTAKHCAVCNYRFTEDNATPGAGVASKPRQLRGLLSLNLPVLLGLLLLIGAIPALVFFGMQKREQTRGLDSAAEATSTYLATTYISPTPTPTVTFTPGPPSATPVVYIEYVVVPGDSCLSISTRFNIFVDSLVLKNGIDCSLLKIGTVLKIPPPVPTPEPTGTEDTTPAP
jgi:hypothetical protein